MIRVPQFQSWTFSALAAAAIALSQSPIALAQRDQGGEPESPQAGAQGGVEVQSRGPVHEAFAGIVAFRPEPGDVVTKAPPDAIEELPPDQKPAGENVAWIPGYWAWDDDRDDFLWVSGVWRALPPGRQWVPGYWTRSGDGNQWITGYWADAKASQIEYLPEPPATIEEGPSAESPSPDQVWIPGTWVWYQGRYVWRPGYWVTPQNNWVWVPAYYVWSPRGYVFVDGYWDYTVMRRGLLFAPVFIDANVYGRRGFILTPSFAVNLAVFAESLFLRPSYSHYYFGNYYGASYASAGFYPWFSFQTRFRNGYDPIFASQRWHNRRNRGWEDNLQAQFEARQGQKGSRTSRGPQGRTEGGADAGKATDGASAVIPLAQLSNGKTGELKLQTVDKQERQELSQKGSKIREFGLERQKIETQGEGKAGDSAPSKSEPASAKLPKSPIAAGRIESDDRQDAPPPPPKAPQPDPAVKPGEPKAGSGRSERDEPRPNKGKNRKDDPGEKPEPGVKPEAGREPPKGIPDPKPGKVEPRPEPSKPGVPGPGSKPKKVEPRPEPPPGPESPRTEPPKPLPKPKKVEPKPEPPKGPALKPEPKPVPPKVAPSPPPQSPVSPPAPPKKKSVPGPKPEAPKPVPPKPEPGEKPKTS